MRYRALVRLREEALGPMKFSKRTGAVYITIVLTLFVVVWSDLIPKWGRWYSSHLVYRWETERLLQGHLSLSQSPADMDWDLAWGKGGVQEVWGLAVPIWRLPFEALAKLIGQPAFPDRLAFIFAFAGVAYIFVRFQQLLSSQLLVQTDPLWIQLGLIPTILFPPFLTLCSSRFIVYEEAEAYGFLVCLLLMVWTGWLWFRPKNSSFFCLSFVSGLVPFFRPTLGVYGAASLILANLIFIKRGCRLKSLCVANGLFLFGIALLLLSNLLRFGSCLEFGTL